MSKTFEQSCLDLYKSIKIEQVKKIIPIIDFFRSLQKKPPIPARQKLCEQKLPTFDEKVILIHGVSVGEILSLEKLIHSIKNTFTDCKIVITTGTVTGQQIASKKYFEAADFITYFPLDIWDACQKFIKTIKPSIVLIAETELWPNFALSCKTNNVPLYIINGRISDKSFPLYSKFAKLTHLILRNYNAIFTQSEEDKQRFINLGASPKTTEVMKNLKFEIEKKACDINLKNPGSKVLIAGSTHKGEDEIIIKAYKQLRSKIIDLRLILAPRHLTRLNDVKAILKKEGLSYGLRSNNDHFEDYKVIILDTLGELSKAYALADVAFIGGSFNNTGGHNPLEALIHSKPVVSGPSIKNFKDIYSILTKENVAFIANNEAKLYQILEKLFDDNSYYESISAKCTECFEKNRGAIEFLINKIKKEIYK